mmetsp:Transcript_44746/g.84071  ORF Transcript_44746/g.84071 Transcript_44746/m.84071 type:complete len:1133 (+) Transcript_44746:246-3644(+)
MQFGSAQHFKDPHAVYAEKPKDETPKEKVSRTTRACSFLLAFTTFVLVIIAVTAPLYAFLVVSCTSTRTCHVGSLLSMANAECQEGAGERSQILMHGETCTVQCFNDKVPNTPVLECIDGVAEGAKGLKCEDPPPPPPGMPTAGGLVKGAITGGELRLVCERAAPLKCMGAPGGTAILLQYPDLTRKECKEILDECKGLNDEFEWMQHSGGTPAPAPNQQPQPSTGECTLGCFNEIPGKALTATPAPPPPPAVLGPPDPGAPTYCGGDTGPKSPICIAISGSCNADDNGDYYRFPKCAAAYAQWVQTNNNHRIRYDGQPQYSQGGKWLIETELLDKDPELSVYGTELARQNSFGKYPILGAYEWQMKCRTRINSFTFSISYQRMSLTLGSCTCTRQGDCSNNGEAVGSKLEGPNCKCVCDSGWTGESCQFPLCKAPDVLYAEIPACWEGNWILAGQVCTPKCELGYHTLSDPLVCSADGTRLVPSFFECKKSRVGSALADAARAQYLGTTTQAPPCTEKDCSYRGTTNGDRRPDGSCICECNENYVGDTCLIYSGQCPAPFDILNAAPASCKEGTVVSTVCTAQCEQGYWPVPRTLDCTVTGDLSPREFKCFGGESVREQWCQAMQYTALGCSVAAFLALAVICIYQVTPGRKPTAPFMVLEEQVDVDKDEHGNFNVVHMAQKDKRSHLPERLQDKTVQEPAPLMLRDVQEPQLALRDVRSPKLALPALAATGESFNEAPPRIQRGASLFDALAIDVESSDKDVAQDQDETLRPEELLRIGAAPQEDMTALTIGDLPSDAAEFALALPGTLPDEPPPTHTDWLVQFRQLDHEAQVNRYKEAQNAANEKMSEEQRAALERAASIKAAVEATVKERNLAEKKMNRAMAAGDAEGLREGMKEAKLLLERVSGAAASITNPLDRLVKIAETRILQHDERESSRKRREQWKNRVRSGAAADWKMTVPELWVHVEAGNLAAVKAGMKAKLPVLNRSSDGKRLTVLHIACKPACVEERASSTKAGADAQDEAEGAGDVRARRLAIVEELLKAKASPNTVDAKELTPLDLAVCEGGEGAESLEVVQALRKLGLRTAKEAAAEFRAEAEAKAEAQRNKFKSAGGRSTTPINSPMRSSRGFG